jgi:hypothetical protein
MYLSYQYIHIVIFFIVMLILLLYDFTIFSFLFDLSLLSLDTKKLLPVMAEMEQVVIDFFRQMSK